MPAPEPPMFVSAAGISSDVVAPISLSSRGIKSQQLKQNIQPIASRALSLDPSEQVQGDDPGDVSSKATPPTSHLTPPVSRYKPLPKPLISSHLTLRLLCCGKQFVIAVDGTQPMHSLPETISQRYEFLFNHKIIVRGAKSFSMGSVYPINSFLKSGQLVVILANEVICQSPPVPVNLPQTRSDLPAASPSPSAREWPDYRRRLIDSLRSNPDQIRQPIRLSVSQETLKRGFRRKMTIPRHMLGRFQAAARNMSQLQSGMSNQPQYINQTIPAGMQVPIQSPSRITGFKQPAPTGQIQSPISGQYVQQGKSASTGQYVHNMQQSQSTGNPTQLTQSRPISQHVSHVQPPVTSQYVQRPSATGMHSNAGRYVLQSQPSTTGQYVNIQQNKSGQHVLHAQTLTTSQHVPQGHPSATGHKFSHRQAPFTSQQIMHAQPSITNQQVMHTKSPTTSQ
eukprot:262162_1